MILKRNGRRTPFDRDKLERSLGIALRKRPVQPEQVEQLVSRDRAPAGKPGRDRDPVLDRRRLHHEGAEGRR